MTSSHKKECGSAHHISRVVSLLSLCGPEDFALLAPAQWILRLAGREVSWPLHQWQSRVISDLLSGYSRGSISSPRQTRLLDEENSPVPSYWSFYSRLFTFLVFSRPQCDICAFFMYKTRFYLFKALRRNKTSSRVLAACQWTFSDEEQSQLINENQYYLYHSMVIKSREGSQLLLFAQELC